MAAAGPRNDLRITRNEGGWAVLEIVREPVNSMDLALWQQLAAALDELEADPQVRGVIFASGLRREVFTAGNDIKELFAPLTSQERYTEFWLTSNRFLARLYASPLVTIAAIRGACPAGGCCLSMCCDYRVMTESGHIGLNEVALGISVPKMWAALMGRIIGTGPADKLLQNAVLLQPQTAKDLGLVDDIAPKEGLLVAAEEVMREMLKMPDGGRQATKLNLRADFAQEWAAFAEPEAQGAWQMLSSPAVVEALGAVLQRLSGGHKLGGGGGKGRQAQSRL